jgi:hypothetical protein
MSRRDLFSLIGTLAGSAVMYEAMSSLAYAGESGYAGPPNLSGDVKGASVLILGSGIVGMTSAYELRKAGYKVQILEYQDRPGGRNWSLYGGDAYAELCGAIQHVGFDTCRVRQGALPQSQPVAAALPSLWDAAFLQALERCARAAVAPAPIPRSPQTASWSPRPIPSCWS